jgi:hypothetical protein
LITAPRSLSKRYVFPESRSDLGFQALIPKARFERAALFCIIKGLNKCQKELISKRS